MKLQIGKRYVRRDRRVTGPLIHSGDLLYPFLDPVHNELYTAEGRYAWNRLGIRWREDLVVEVV